jgi:hypothetical protein
MSCAQIIVQLIDILEQNTVSVKPVYFDFLWHDCNFSEIPILILCNAVSQCFCGNKIDPQANLTNDNNCNTPCSGNLDEICGGAWNMSIYRSKS